jgi:hypothetical protein
MGENSMHVCDCSRMWCCRKAHLEASRLQSMGLVGPCGSHRYSMIDGDLVRVGRAQVRITCHMRLVPDLGAW